MHGQYARTALGTTSGNDALQIRETTLAGSSHPRRMKFIILYQ